jgi:hypothetical protein
MAMSSKISHPWAAAAIATAATAALVAQTPARAADFTISGTFGNTAGCESILPITPTACNPFSTALQLRGGSFDGIYSTVGNLPVSSFTSLASVLVNLRDAAGNIVLTYTAGSVSNSVLTFSPNIFPSSFLELSFGPGFNGSGVGSGRFQQNVAGSGSTSISASATSIAILPPPPPPTPIPTPPLLPGLVGMGLAALKKPSAQSLMAGLGTAWSE